jgi:anaerobic selenocysteine-containing dehydrogenase
MSQHRETIYSTCYMCTEDCPITVITDGDDIVSVEHPDCPRAGGMMEQRTSPARWTDPKLRSRVGDP